MAHGILGLVCGGQNARIGPWQLLNQFLFPEVLLSAIMIIMTIILVIVNNFND